MLIDSGASVSVLKSYCVSGRPMNANNRKVISGICGKIFTIGRANVRMYIENANFVHEFDILDDFATPPDGILGVLSNASIDYEKRIFKFFISY